MTSQMADSDMKDVSFDAASPRKVDLEWQSFPVSASTAAHPPPSGAPLTASTSASSSASADPAAEAEALAGTLACFTPAFYVNLFDVDTAEVNKRLKLALWPLTHATFMQQLNGKPDLYGPVWICATLVFVVGAASNLHSWATFTPEAGVSFWKYDFSLVTLALFSVYGFVLGAASVVFALLNYFAVPSLLLVTLVCVYGYSMAVFIPAALLCTIPSAAFQWIVVMLAALLSFVFVFKTLWPALRDASADGPSRFVIGAAFAGQIAFAVFCKIYFFSY